MQSSRAPQLILEASHLACLVSPARKELLSAFLLKGPCAVADVAGTVRTPVKSLYYHVRAMKRAGLIREVGSRGLGRERESIFDATAERYTLQKSDRSPTYLEQEFKSVRATLRLATREYERAVLEEADTFVLRLSARLKRQDYEAVKSRIQEALELAKQLDHKDGAIYTLTAVVAEKPPSGASPPPPNESGEELK